MSEQPEQSEVYYRPLDEDDAPALQEFVSGLSEDTFYKRFFGYKHDLPDAEAEHFTSVDHIDREAIAAVQENDDDDGDDDDDGEQIIGVARYDQLDNPAEAEIAIVVRDDLQHSGVGTLLMNLLIRAANENDIEYFKSERLASNHVVRDLLHQVCGEPVESPKIEGGVIAEAWPVPDLHSRNGRITRSALCVAAIVRRIGSVAPTIKPSF